MTQTETILNVEFVAYLTEDYFRPLPEEFVRMFMVIPGERCIDLNPRAMTAPSRNPSNDTVPDSLLVLLQLPTGVTRPTEINFSRAIVTKIEDQFALTNRKIFTQTTEMANYTAPGHSLTFGELTELKLKESKITVI